ncbi:unnamed protein product [Calicophoron daubneyi]|uniref:Tetratricopeptide repeat protein 12 n=1 Tax=Calicophoron daubneyi TaxID=300641 RepID=A0AAV2TT06_CALDB
MFTLGSAVAFQISAPLMDQNDAQLDSRKLTEVDEVLNIVKKLSSADEAVSAEAVRLADDYLKNKLPSNPPQKGFSRTVINAQKTAEDQRAQDANGFGEQSTDVAAFMSAVEKDAAERAQRRAQQRTRAGKIKDRANAFFKAGDWRRAIDLYTQAIQIAKDWEILYTNRAQAYLRLGEPKESLADCDTALAILHPQDEKSGEGDAGKPDSKIAKTYFHRGKALMALGQPKEALLAYSSARTYTPRITRDGGADLTETWWPSFLVEYVAQAEAALTAQEADAKAEAEFEANAIKSPSQLDGHRDGGYSTGQQLICLLAQLARGNQDPNYYSAGLRQLTRLLDSAPRKPSQLPDDTLVNDTTMKVENTAAAPPLPSAPPPPTPGNPATRRGRRKRVTVKGNQREKKTIGLSSQVRSGVTPTPTVQMESFSELQSLFRVKKGFSLLNREINAISQSMGLGSATGVGDSSHKTVSDRTEGAQPTPDSRPVTDPSDRLLALLNLTTLLTNECGENQRILIEQHPRLIRIGLDCLTLAPEFVQKLTKHITNDLPSGVRVGTSANQFCQLKLETLRAASADLFVTLTSQPSGRQALLTCLGPGPLLNAISACLDESLTLSKTDDSQTRPSSVVPYTSGSSATSAVCAARAARILENFTESPGFLIAVRSSTENLKSLLSVIEAALSTNTTGKTGRFITTTAQCLANLLDSLSSVCQDESIRTSILQCRQPLLSALADTLQSHAPLLSDNDHIRLVRSACRLLHNICVGQLSHITDDTKKKNSNSLASCMASSDRLADCLLNGVGAILDQPGHGPELRSVAVALAGRLLPLCSSNRVLTWLGDTANSDHANSELSERIRLLLAILDSCSMPPEYLSNSTAQLPRGPPDKSEEPVPLKLTEDDQLSAHLLGGCIRCLAAATRYSLSVRYAIGDDRRRVRRIARITRCKLQTPPLPPAKSNPTLPSCSPPSVRRDEVLAGNACLILQNCCDDTPLAEHLQGTSVIMDLLLLIQDSQRLETKRNAAILIGKLAQASHIHRDELSRLDGWNVLTPFNSWSSSLGQL